MTDATPLDALAFKARFAREHKQMVVLTPDEADAILLDVHRVAHQRVAETLPEAKT